jgi:hypothetical protein
MPRKGKELSATAIRNRKYEERKAPKGTLVPCAHAVGGVACLMLLITPSDHGKSWLSRTRIGSRGDYEAGRTAWLNALV